MNWNNLVSATAKRLNDMQKISEELKGEIPQFAIEFANNIERCLHSALTHNHSQYNYPFYNEDVPLYRSFEIFPRSHDEMTRTLDAIEGGDANLGYSKKTQFRCLFEKREQFDKQWVRTWLLLFCQLTEIELKSRFEKVNDIVGFSVRTDETSENNLPLIVVVKTIIYQKVPSPASVVFQTVSTKEITKDFIQNQQHKNQISIGTTDPNEPIDTNQSVDSNKRALLNLFNVNAWF